MIALSINFCMCFNFGKGCNASILVDGPSTEKTAGPNLSVRGYEFIEALKATMEEQCPGVVSCADIIAIATKVVIKEEGGPDYAVQTGRRDGLQSNALDVDLSTAFMTVPEAVAVFAAKNLTAEEMVVLLGCHMIGITHCGFFQDRLYQNTIQFDPAMDQSLRKKLMGTCPSGTLTNNPTPLNQKPGHGDTVDNSFFGQLLKNRGILAIDQALSRHTTTNGTVLELSSNATLFNIKLASAMLKLQAVEVLTGNQGQIRKVCGKVN